MPDLDDPNMHGFPIDAPAALERGPSWLDGLNAWAKSHGGLLTLLGVALSAWAMRRRT